MTALHALASYARVRSFPYRIRSREALQSWQETRLQHWLAHDVPQVAAFARQGALRLDDLPIMDKATLMEDFSRYTKAAISNAQGWAAFEGPKRLGALTVGASTGTSGNRGLFVISEAERFAWLGAILAKAVPEFWRHRERVAVVLPLDTPLYDSANRMARLSLAFFDINTPFDHLAAALDGFEPTLLIAPPRILRRLAGRPMRRPPRRVFSAAEKLEEMDRGPIEAGFGCRLDEIYMATEGLFAVTCKAGRLHLTEDCMHFAFESVGGGLVRPILSDFSRKEQIMARYRMNDLLRLDPSPCACGSPLMGVAEIVGREDDLFWLQGQDGGVVELTPDILRNAIVDSDRAIDDFRLVQTGPRAMRLELAPHIDPTPAVSALTALFARHGCGQGLRIAPSVIDHNTPGKLRRIRQDWRSSPPKEAAWTSSRP